MILLLEIYMTYAAWKKGWRGWALMPLVAALALGFAIGMGSGGELPENMFAIALLVDGAVLVALGVMIATGRQSLPAETDENLAKEDDETVGADSEAAAA